MIIQVYRVYARIQTRYGTSDTVRSFAKYNDAKAHYLKTVNRFQDNPHAREVSLEKLSHSATLFYPMETTLWTF